jgi:hypothetical protein
MLNLRVVSLFAVVTAVMLAANPIATVVSGDGLKVRGTAVPATSVSSWPVASGDELASGASPAVVMFKGQSRLTLNPNSRVKLEARGDSVCIFLLDGSIRLSAVAGATIAVCGRGKSMVAQTPFEGQVTLAGQNTIKVDAITGTLAEGKTPCATSPIFAAMGGKTAAIVIIAAAAGGTAAGIALTRGDEPALSPSAK